ncbi:hypothetical protein PCYB_006530, partial [Plasmodium cynomolgi strain B]
MTTIEQKIEILFEEFSTKFSDDDYDEDDDDDKVIIDFKKECDGTSIVGNSDNAEYSDFCMTLIKNLHRVILNDDDSNIMKSINYVSPNTKCNTLRIWIYYILKIHCVPSQIINQLFNAMKTLDSNLADNSKYTECKYSLFNVDNEEKDRSIQDILNLVDKSTTIQEKLTNGSGLYNWCHNNNNNDAMKDTKLIRGQGSDTSSLDNVYTNLFDGIEALKPHFKTLIEKTQPLSSTQKVEPQEITDKTSTQSISTNIQSTAPNELKLNPSDRKEDNVVISEPLNTVTQSNKAKIDQ